MGTTIGRLAVLLLAAALPLAAAGPWASGPSYSCSVQSTTVRGSSGRYVPTKQVTCTFTGSAVTYDVYWLWWKIGTAVEYFDETRFVRVSGLLNAYDPPVKLYISTGAQNVYDGYAIFTTSMKLPTPIPGYTLSFNYRLGRNYVEQNYAIMIAIMDMWGIEVKDGGTTWQCGIPGASCRPTTPTPVRAWFTVLIVPRSAETGSVTQLTEPSALAIALDNGIVALVVYNPLAEPVALKGVEVEGAAVEEQPQPIVVQPNGTDVTFLKLAPASGTVMLTARLEDGSGRTYNQTLTIELGQQEAPAYPAYLLYVAIAVVAAAALLFALGAARHTVEDEAARRRRFVRRRG